MFAMSDEERQVASTVRDAFHCVPLGNGIGLLEAQAIDDYKSDQTRAKYRNTDEKDDWSRIPAKKLNDYYSSLSFFDAEGMRFHLPAFIVAELEGTYTQDVVFHLTYSRQENLSRFDLLNSSQRQAVREFLLLRLAQYSEWPENPTTPMIEQALDTYWLPDSTKHDA
jgi:hypothetical protein